MSGRKARRRASGRSGGKLVAKRKKKTGRVGSRTPDQLMAKMEECLEGFLYEEAVRCGMEAVKMDPLSPHLLERVGPVLMEMGHTDEAFECLQKAVQLSPDKGHLKYLYLGQLSSGERAVQYLTSAIRIMTREMEGSQPGGGTCDSVCGNGEGVCGEGVRSVDLSAAYCSLAEVFLTDACFSSDAEQRCYESCQKAVQCCPGNPEAHQIMASCLLSMNRPEEAEVAVKKSLLLWLPATSDKGSENEVTRSGGVNGAGVSGAGVSGTGVSGAGMSGDSVSGAGSSVSGAADVDGAGVSGAGVTGASVDGTGVSGAGVTGAGVTGASVSGAGVTGAGVSGAGVSGAGVSGAGVESPPYFCRVSCAKILMELEMYREASVVLDGLLRDDDEVVVVWYLMGWLHTLTSDTESATFYLEQAHKLSMKTDCDDEQMVQHIQELLDDLVKKEEEEEEEEKEEGGNKISMDTS